MCLCVCVPVCVHVYLCVCLSDGERLTVDFHYQQLKKCQDGQFILTILGKP